MTNKQNTQLRMETLDCLFASEHPTEKPTSSTLTQLFDRGCLSYIKGSVLSILELLEVRFRSQVAGNQSTRRQLVRDSLEDRVLSSKFNHICSGEQAEEKTNRDSLEDRVLSSTCYHICSGEQAEEKTNRDSLEDRVLSSTCYHICSGGQAEEKTNRDSLEDRVLSSTCYHICSGGQAEEKTKEQVLQELIMLFLKITIHNKCKIVMDEYRNMHRLQSKKRSSNESQNNISLLLLVNSGPHMEAQTTSA